MESRFFRATEGKVNEFELSGGSKNRAYNYRVWRVKGSWVWLEYRGAFSIYQNLSETSIERSIEWGKCSIWHKFHSFMLSSPKCKMVAKILPWTAWNWWLLVEHAFPLENFRRENWATFSKLPLLPGIFQWNARKTCLLLASQPELLDKWKAPRDSTVELFPQLHWLSLASLRSHGIYANTVSRRHIRSEGNRTLLNT